MEKHAGLYYMEDLEELFVDIQLQKVFPDQKTFADCAPRYPIAEILERYRLFKKEMGSDLLSFVHDNFSMPAVIPQPKERRNFPIDEHIRHLWKILSRPAGESGGTLIPLPYPSIVPGGRFREIFYWDTYFTMLGLQEAGEFDMLENMIANFSYLIDTFGFIPNGNRTYFLTRSQPPYFSYMLRLLAEVKGEQVLVDHLPQLTAEHQFWMRGSNLLTAETPVQQRTVLLPGGEVLNRHWDERNTPRPEGYAADLKTHERALADPSDHYRHVRGACESGWDFSGRWFKDGLHITTIHTCDFVPVDLNCLLWHLETTLAEAYKLAGKTETAASYGNKADARKQTILHFCWNEKEQAYTDYDHVTGQPADSPTMAMAFPLFCGIAPQREAVLVLNRLEKDFLRKGGLLTTLMETGQQWDYPNGWAPLQWIGYKAALNYGRPDLATKIAEYWTRNVEHIFSITGKLMEKYNVVDGVIAKGGEYANQDGFGWTNGVYAKLKALQAGKH